MDTETKFGIGIGIVALGIGAIAGIAYYREAHRPEPVHARLPASHVNVIKKALLDQGFKEVVPPEEVRKVGEIWGMAKYLPDNERQMHVRAIVNPSRRGEIYLSAHVEARRDHIPEHLKGNADNEQGRRWLLDFLRTTGLDRWSL